MKSLPRAESSFLCYDCQNTTQELVYEAILVGGTVSNIVMQALRSAHAKPRS